MSASTNPPAAELARMADQRKAFEDAVRQQGWPLARSQSDPDAYDDDDVSLMWIGWLLRDVYTTSGLERSDRRRAVELRAQQQAIEQARGT